MIHYGKQCKGCAEEDCVCCEVFLEWKAAIQDQPEYYTEGGYNEDGYDSNIFHASGPDWDEKECPNDLK